MVDAVPDRPGSAVVGPVGGRGLWRMMGMHGGMRTL